VLAQADGGLSCFLLPRVLPDGTRNRFHLQRLKEKLGNRSNASSEVEFHGAWARLLGEEGRGVPTIIEMVNHTRLDCVCGSAGSMRAGVAQATHHAAHRSAFGKLLADQPAMQNVLADLSVESEAATITAMRLARAYDQAAESEHETLLKRLATAVSKYWVCKRSPVHAIEALECLGGNGYIEESGMPRLYRESPLNSIWEGSGNVICLDVLRALARSPESLEAFMDEVDEAVPAEPRLARFVGRALQLRGRRAARPEHRRAHGARAPGLARRALRRPGGCRRLLRVAARRRLGPRIRHAADRDRRALDHRAPPAEALDSARFRGPRSRARSDVSVPGRPLRSASGSAAGIATTLRSHWSQYIPGFCSGALTLPP
jgi:hypothetical protein